MKIINNSTLRVQIKLEIFKPSGKYYTDDFVVIDAPVFALESSPIQLSYEVYDMVKSFLKGRYSGMTVYVTHDLLVPHLIHL